MRIEPLQVSMAAVANRVLPQDGMGSPDRATATAGRVMNPADFPAWDALLANHSGFSFFHSAAWAKTLEASYGFAPVYLMTGEMGAVGSVLPLMEVNSRLTGRRGIGLPFTDACGPLYEDGDGAVRMVQSAIALGRSRGWKSVEFRGGRELFPGAPAAVSFYGHRLNLQEGEAALFAGLDGSTRRAIRKAEKSGVTVAISGGMDAMRVFYSLHCKTRRKHGLPPQPFIFFRNICHHIFSRNQGMVAVASWQNRPVAASVYFQLGPVAIYKFGASDESFQQVRGASLVMWEAIRHLLRNGARAMDMGRTSMSNEGLRRFKLNWGAQEHKIEYVKYDLRKSAFVTETDAATGWHNWIFRALPSGVSRMIGAALYRHLA